jgi:hypothetical protein
VEDIEKEHPCFLAQKTDKKKNRASVGERKRQAEFAAQGHVYNSEKK